MFLNISRYENSKNWGENGKGTKEILCEELRLKCWEAWKASWITNVGEDDQLVTLLFILSAS